MKELSIERMETVSGGVTSSGTQVSCFIISVAYGFINPFLGIVSGAACLFVD